MKGFIFFLASLASGVGFYFLLPIMVLALPLFVPIFCLYHLADSLLKEEVQKEEPKRKSVSIRHITDEYILDTFNLSKSEQEAVKQQACQWSPILLERLPSDSILKFEVQYREGFWQVCTRAFSSKSRFCCEVSGEKLEETFSKVKSELLTQVQEWMAKRVLLHLDPALSPQQRQKNISAQGPRILIIDDDIDAAQLVRAAFQRLGCDTQVITAPDAAACMIKHTEADLIVLDWDLGERVYADDLLQDSILEIERSPTLQRHFSIGGCPVITYSGSEERRIHLPQSPYFKHVEHWQKPMPLAEIHRRSERFLNLQLAS